MRLNPGFDDDSGTTGAVFLSLLEVFKLFSELDDGKSGVFDENFPKNLFLRPPKTLFILFKCFCVAFKFSFMSSNLVSKP